MSRAVIISNESVSGFTGGSIYLNSILVGLRGSFKCVDVHCVGDRESVDATELGNVYTYKKHRIKMLFSMIFLQLSILSLHSFAILRRISCSDADVVFFHSTKMPLLLFLVKLFTSKKIVLVTDNVEFLLGVELKSNQELLKFRILYSIFAFVSYISEYICFKFSNLSTFITSKDQSDVFRIYGSKESLIWPITLASREVARSQSVESYALFTGSFRFPPNVDAVQDAIRLSARYNFPLKLAGLDAGRLVYSGDSVEVVDSPESAEMNKLFESAAFFISPVSYGSGMKAKIAEALMYGLPILSTSYSLIGYEEIIDSEVVCLTSGDEDDISKFLLEMLGEKRTYYRESSRQLFEKYYSTARSIEIANSIKKYLGVI